MVEVGLGKVKEICFAGQIHQETMWVLVFDEFLLVIFLVALAGLNCECLLGLSKLEKKNDKALLMV